jgi:hypothetical protein
MGFGLLSKLLGRPRLPDRLRYEDARDVLEGHGRRMKRELAGREDAPPETLYYLACDDDLEVRSLVAIRQHRSMPMNFCAQTAALRYARNWRARLRA